MEEKHIYRIYKIIEDDVIPTSYVSNDLYTIRRITKLFIRGKTLTETVTYVYRVDNSEIKESEKKE